MSRTVVFNGFQVWSRFRRKHRNAAETVNRLDEWISPTWVLLPSVGLNNPGQPKKEWSHSSPELYRPLRSSASSTRSRKKATFLLLQTSRDWCFLFLSASAELLTWPISVSCNSSTHTHVISLQEDEWMKGRRTQRCHLSIFTRRCRDWQLASEVSSFTPILRQNGAPAVTWPRCGLKLLFKGKHLF